MRTDRRAGFTMLEVAIVLAVLTIAIAGSLAVMTALLHQNTASIETGRATQALRNKIEEMRTYDYGTLWLACQSGGVIGNTFSVAGLNPPAGGGDHGLITFIGERDVRAYWGRTTDFDQDGTTSSPPPSTHAQAVSWTAYPVRVRVDWSDQTQGIGRQIEVTTIIYNQNK